MDVDRVVEAREIAVSTERAAELLDVSFDAVRYLVNSDRVPTVKIGGSVRIPVAALVELTIGDLAVAGMQGEQRPKRLSVSYKTAGRMLELSEDTIRRLVDAGRLGAVQIGSRPRIAVATLERFIDSNVGGRVSTEPDQPPVDVDEGFDEFFDDLDDLLDDLDDATSVAAGGS